MVFIYHITFIGYGANRTLYRNQRITLRGRHNWDENDEEAANVLFLVRKEIKKHFSRFEIISIEKEH